MLSVRQFCLCVLLVCPVGAQVLYNGITSPAPWPPNRKPTQIYQLPPYLASPPDVIPIDIGRQLFIDDFLIEQTTLTRIPHRPVMHPLNPVLAPGGADSKDMAMPFSDGVWYDPADRLFKMWYFGGYGNMISYAHSSDGKDWTKPSLSDAVVPGTNMVLQIGGGRDSTTVWMDLDDPAPGRKFKAFAYHPETGINAYFSPDGIHWTKQSYRIPALSDRTTMFWNPFRQVWVNSLRTTALLPTGTNRLATFARVRNYAESKDLSTWTPADVKNSFWHGPDETDPSYVPGGAFPELYALDAVAYESLIVGLFSWFHPGPDYDADYGPGPNLVELGVGFSRDGYYWVRPTRGSGAKAFISATNLPGTWNAYNTQSSGGCFLVVGDELWFYFSGRKFKKPAGAGGSTGLAILRRDGFYSMDAAGSPGVLTTRPVRFSGRRLFVNVDSSGGELQVEVLDSNGNVIAPFTKANSVPVSVNSTVTEIAWTGAADLAALAGRAVKFRFHLTQGSLYSFWVAPDSNGASHGYVAAGGPGFTTSRDVLGRGSMPTVTSTPVITPAGGPFRGSVTVSISAGTPGAVIRYTLDGSEPDAFSTVYTGPFQLTSQTTVKAKAFAEGLAPSGTATAAYVQEDQASPTAQITSPQTGVVVWGVITLAAAVTDNVAVSRVQFQVDGVNVGAELTQAPYTTLVDASRLTPGQHTITAMAYDAAGNQAVSPAIQVTVAAPVYQFSPATGVAPASGAAGSVSLTVTPATTSWTAVSSQVWLTIQSGSGTGSGTISYTVAPNTSTLPRTAMITVGGAAYSVTQSGASAPADSVPPQPPTVVSVTPASGSGAAPVFAGVASDANGAADISAVYLLVSASLNGAHACFAEYSRSGNQLRLMNDAGNGWLGPIGTGSGTLSNSQCTLHGAGSGGTTSGNKLTAGFVLTFTSAFAGDKKLYLFAVDSGGGNSGYAELGTWTATGGGAQSGQPPTAVSVSPNSGSGASQTFTVTGFDADGATDIDAVYMLVNASLYGANACFVEYTRAGNQFRLMNDAGNGWLGPISAGSGTLSNAQCTLNGAGSSGTSSASQVTANLALIFAAGFTGARSVYLFVVDQTGVNSGYQALGTWEPGGGGNPQPPVALTVTPDSGSGASRVFTALTSDANGDVRFVYLLISGSVNGANACFVEYDRAASRFRLMNDAGNGWLGPINAGSGSLANSQCTLNGGNSGGGTSGNNVVANMALDFAASFAGARSLYVFAVDGSRLDSGYQALGTWTVP